MRTKKTVALLQARIDQLEAQAANGSEEQRTSRRGMLRLAGAAAVGGLATVVTAQPAAAGVDNDVVLNLSTNPGLTPTGIAMQPTAQAYGLGCYENGLGALNAALGRPAILGHATGSAFTSGVAGHNAATGGSAVIGLDTAADTTGNGILGRTTNGVAVWADGGGIAVLATSATGVGISARGILGALRMNAASPDNLVAPPSRTGLFVNSTIDVDDDNNVWFCYESGTPGKWRKLAGPSTAGAFHAITPTRVYDSRAAAPSPGILDTGSNRTISVADGRSGGGVVTTSNLVPAGATAVAANITITGTTGGGGYLSVNPGGITTGDASTINWFGPGQNIANGVTLTLNTNRELTVVCGAGGGSTHLIIDIAGYYL